PRHSHSRQQPVKKQKGERGSDYREIQQTKNRDRAPMKPQGISLDHKSNQEQWHSAENHLPRRNHGRRELNRAGFEQDVRKRSASRSKHDAKPTPESHESVESKKALADHCNAAEREERPNELGQLQRFLGKH